MFFILLISLNYISLPISQMYGLFESHELSLMQEPQLDQLYEVDQLETLNVAQPSAK